MLSKFFRHIMSSYTAPPKITKKLQDFTGLTGRELNLTIQVEGSPKPIIQW